ncbi:MAG: S8 family serine peptidase, partial [Pseudobdellovibrionaceae bacterium]
IDRGVITFVDKAKKAEEAGAIAAIIVNNQAGEPFGMGGSGSTEIPAVMISQADGEVLKEEMKKTAVRGDLKSGKTVFRPELMDTLTSFSSKGPRSIDSHIKPEVAAPGMMIVSAEMGGGKAGVKLSGTSMATPHVAGVAALLRQKEPNLTADQVKSRIVGSTLTIKDEKGVRYPVSRQGAGRVDVMRVLTAGVQAMPATVSLGEVSIETRKKMRQSFAIQNNTAEEMVLDLSAQTVEGLQVQVPQSVKVKANSSETITLDISIQAKADNNSVKELDGWVFVKKQNQEVSRIPLLAVVKRISKVSAEKLTIHSSGEEDSDGSLVTLSLKNSSAHAGDAYLFNLIGKDGRKVNLTPAESHLDTSCDLESAGYRLIVKSGVPTLQVAFKLYNALTRWSTCQLTALVDADGDGIAEQELAGIVGTQLKGIESKEFMSLLMDAKKVREIRKAYEGTLGAPEPVKENYVDAIIADAPMVFHNHSTIAIVETPLKALARAKDGSLRIKVGSLQVIGDAQEADDFMGQGEEQWKSIRPYENSEAFVGLPEKVSLKAGEATEVSFEKGKGAESLLVLMPQNLSFPDGIVGDRQSQIVAPIFGN